MNDETKAFRVNKTGDTPHTPWLWQLMRCCRGVGTMTPQNLQTWRGGGSKASTVMGGGWGMCWENTYIDGASATGCEFMRGL